MNGPILEVRDLQTVFETRRGTVCAVDGVSLALGRGEVLGLAGESGCGKSVTAMSVMRLVPSPPGRIVSGEILFQGRDLLGLNNEDMRRVRGSGIAMIFQEPMTSLNPVFTIGDQIAEAVRLRRSRSPRGKGGRKEALDEAAELLDRVGILAARRRLGDYPGQLSGGMRQRAMIAMALAGESELLIADEPTTALDVTVEAQILSLLDDLRIERGLAMILISHDLSIIAQQAQRAAVMYAGRIVEEGGAEALVATPLHPYTKALIRSIPGMSRAGGAGRRLPSIPGAPPDPHRLPAGCKFRDRCPFCPECSRPDEPPLIQVEPGRRVRCWEYGQSL